MSTAGATFCIVYAKRSQRWRVIVGQTLFQFLAENPNSAVTFNHAMTAASRQQAEAVCVAYDFSNSTVVDVGGGHGFLLLSILRGFPTARGILFDLPSVMSEVGDLPKAEELRSRYQVIAGNFFEDLFPPETHTSSNTSFTTGVTARLRNLEKLSQVHGCRRQNPSRRYYYPERKQCLHEDNGRP